MLERKLLSEQEKLYAVLDGKHLRIVNSDTYIKAFKKKMDCIDISDLYQKNKYYELDEIFHRNFKSV